MNTSFKARLSLLVLLNLAVNSFAQQLEIKREMAVGTAKDEGGKHALLITPTEQLLVLSTYNSVAGNYQFEYTVLENKQTQVNQGYTGLINGTFETKSIIETRDKGYVMIGTAKRLSDPKSIRIIREGPFGRFYWERGFTGNADNTAVGIIQTSDGGYLMLGNVLSSDSMYGNSTGKNQVWMTKLDSNANMIYNKLITNTHAHTAHDLKKCPDGNYVIAGSVSDDVPLGAGRSTADGFVMKITESGDVLWKITPGANGNQESLQKMHVDAAGFIYAAGSSNSTDGDFSSNHGGRDGWLTKISAAGVLQWHKLMGGSKDDEFSAIAVTGTGLIYAGGYTLSNDGQVAGNRNAYTIWATEFDEKNNKIAHGFFGHTAANKSAIDDMVADRDGNIYCVANSDASNPYMRSPKGLRDAWVFVLSKNNSIKLSAFADLNNNGSKDAGEKNFPAGRFEITKTSSAASPVHLASSTGELVHFIDTGSYTVTFRPELPYFNVVPASKNFSFASINNTDSVIFRVVPIPGKQDLAVNAIAQAIPRPGFETYYLLHYANKGSATVSNTELKYVKDKRLTLTAIRPQPTRTSGDTLIWNTGTLYPLDTGYIALTAKIAAPPSTSFGDTLHSFISISPDATDETKENNSLHLRELVMGSYDPNDKSEYHTGQFSLAAVPSGAFNYLIRFQNTGNDTAFNVIIRDTLDSKLDWQSLEMTGASHSYKMNVVNGNLVEWSFADILLPDSNRNERLSHGYLSYTVRPKATVTTGDEIKNTASIYFDFNLPIRTNTTSTKIVSQSLPKPQVPDLRSSYCGNDGPQKIKIQNIAAANGAQVKVTINNIITPVDVDGYFIIDPKTLSAGTYNSVISFITTGSQSDLSFVFTIVAPVSPVVKLNSSLSSISNNTSPVTFTATPVSGAGTTPLYSFSANSNFNPLVRGEEAGTSITMYAPSFIQGDNWMYVRMRSNSSCATSATATDSVKIIKTAVTSISDPYFPGAMISVFPNPSVKDLYIKGLQPALKYEISVMDITGRRLKTIIASGTGSYTFTTFAITRGTYFIRIIETGKHRLIGTIPVIKQ